jgi:hypothetical protein
VEDDQQRFIAETGYEAHYWFVVSDFVDLSLRHGLDTVLGDALEVYKKRLLDKEQS